MYETYTIIHISIRASEISDFLIFRKKEEEKIDIRFFMIFHVF